MTLTPLDYIPLSIAGLDIAAFGAQEDPTAPLVFVTHGLGGTMFDVASYCREIAAAGMVAIALEQRNHGRRFLDNRYMSFATEHGPTEMFGIVVGTALDVSLLLDLVEPRLGLAPQRVGMTGISLGGRATLVTMALDARIQVGASLIGTGDFRDLLTWHFERGGMTKEDIAQRFPPALERVLTKYDAVHHAEQFANRPLLLTTGAQDDIVPAECVERFTDQIRTHYTHAERLLLSVYPDLGHAAPSEMRGEAIAWLKRWLSDTEAI